jgi:4-amino-4-deoxy-L-arabinose transferase-like glycosyltransferase
MVEAPHRRFSFSGGLQAFLILVLLLLSALIVLGQANPFTTRLGRDSGMYAYVASHLLQGKTPYVTAWEHKPPLIFFIDAAGLWLGRGTRWGIWGVELLCLLGASVAGFSALKRSFGLGSALLASVVWLTGLSLVLEGGNFTEEYALLFNFTALWLFTLIVKRPGSLWLHAALGLAFGLSFLTRPNNAGVPAAILLTEVVLALLQKDSFARLLRGLLAAAVGFLVPLLGSGLYFLSRNAFQAFLEAGFIYNLSYGGQPAPVESLLGGIRNLGFAAGIGLVGMWVAFDQLREQLRQRELDPLILWLCLDFVLEIVLSGLSGFNYPHYFISWLPWIAFAAGVLFNRLSGSFPAWTQRHALVFVLGAIVLLAAGSLSTLRDYGRGFTQLRADRSKAQEAEQVPAYVNEHTQPGQTVLVWGGNAGINFLAGRAAPTAHFQYGILVPSTITDRISAQFYQDISSHPPAMILDQSDQELPPLSIPNPVAWSAAHGVYAPPYLQQFFDFVHANYTYKTSVAGVAVYDLNR